jgi:hypothetical protein
MTPAPHQIAGRATGYKKIRAIMNLSRREAIRRLAVLSAVGVVSRHAWAAEPHLAADNRQLHFTLKFLW